MSTATFPAPRTSPPAAVRLTAADLAVMPRTLPSGDVKWELDDGVLVPMSPPGYFHGRVTALLTTQLQNYVERTGSGVVTDEVGVVLRRNPDRVVGPDGLVILSRSLPPRVSPEGYLETIPEVIIEVRSKNDSGPEIAAKVQEYLDAGVLVVWVLDPEPRTVTEYRPGQPPRVFPPTEPLACDLLPGFAVPVDRLFAGS